MTEYTIEILNVGTLNASTFEVNKTSIQTINNIEVQEIVVEGRQGLPGPPGPSAPAGSFEWNSVNW